VILPVKESLAVLALVLAVEALLAAVPVAVANSVAAVKKPCNSDKTLVYVALSYSSEALFL